MNSSYTVIARRYRPQVFEEVIGQEYITTTLKNAVTENKVAHAYIFSGTRGVGKTSLARIFSKALNCKAGPTAEPCGNCEFCKSIAEGNDPDVIEIDAASQTGVNDIRLLQESIGYIPFRAKYKIYIMDEAHQLSKSAFNALLKTIEEPPPHVKFIFATTDPGKLPETILSRCQRFNFRPISGKKIYNQLDNICRNEKFSCQPKILTAIARMAHGSMRDAQSLLDLAISSCSEKGVLTDPVFLTDEVSFEQVARLADAIAGNKMDEIVLIVNDVLSDGREANAFIEQLIEHFWCLILLQISSEKIDLLAEEVIEDRDRLHNQARHFKVNTLLDFISFLYETKRNIKETVNVRLYLEFAVLKLSRLFKEHEEKRQSVVKYSESGR
jgi:DNA polymerase-3 subunit gamma/tau